MQVVDVVLDAELLQRAPVFVGHAEPLRVAGADVDVDGGKVVVLLVAGGSWPGHLHKMKMKRYTPKRYKFMNEKNAEKPTYAICILLLYQIYCLFLQFKLQFLLID